MPRRWRRWTGAKTGGRWLVAAALSSALGSSLGATACEPQGAAEAIRIGPIARALTERARVLPEAPASPSPARDDFPRLDDEPEGVSWSTGDTSHGRVFHARAVRESEALAILPKQKARDLRYGTDELVTLLEHAASRLHAATKRSLWIGNLGRIEGGDIPWSVSHNAGRDADIAFAYLDARGAPVDPPDLVPLDRSGRSKDGTLRFDAARTWTIVRALIDHPTVQTQYLFIAAPLEKQLLERAKAAGEPAVVIDRAAELLHEPGGAAPHDDHLHLRIRCGARDLAAGCVDAGPTRPWDKTFPAVRGERVRAALAALRAAAPDARRRAALRLALMGAREHADTVAARLDDDTASVRAAAARALGELGDARHAGALARRFAVETDGEVLVSLLAGAARIGGSNAGALLADAIAADAGPLAEAATELAPGLEGGGQAAPAWMPHPTAGAAALWIAPTPSPFRPVDPGAALVDRSVLRDVAIAMATVVDASEPGAPLTALLASGDVDLRLRAAAALEHVANRRTIDFADPAQTDAEREEAVKRWRAIVAGLAKSPRDAWIATGFLASGYKVPNLDRKHAWELVRAVGGPPYTSQAARRWLARLEGEPDAGLDWSAGEACRRWLNWFGQRHRRYRIERAPEAVKRACWSAPR